MANEESICQELAKEFPFLAERTKVKRERRVFTEAAYPHFAAVFHYAVRSMQFSQLVTITGTDEGETLGVMYHLSRPDGTVLNLKTAVPKADPRLNTISPYFPSGAFYERELMDLLGFQVHGLPAHANRYPLQDDWPQGQYPLRKDWDPSVLDRCKGE